jgi:biotin carboxylase
LLEERTLDPEERVLAILGGSLDQLASINEARQLGLKTLVIDANEKCAGFKVSDYKLLASTRNSDSILHKLRDFENSHRKLIGFFVQGTDIPQIGATLSAHFKIQSIDKEVARLSVDKFRMKKFLESYGFPVPNFIRIDNFSDFKLAAKTLGFPFVVKPIDRSGARGVLRIENSNQVNCENFELSLSESLSNQLIAEQYISGAQFSTESLIVNGTAHTLIIAERNYEFIEKYSPYILENGGWSDNLLSPNQELEIKNLLQKLADKLGINRGVIKGDLVLSEHGIVIIEFALRVSGGDLSESLIPLGTGLNYLSLAIRNTIGDEILSSELVPQDGPCVANRYFFPSDGLIKLVPGEIARPNYVKKLQFWVQDETRCFLPRSHADRVGVFILTGVSRSEVKLRCEKTYALYQPTYS